MKKDFKGCTLLELYYAGDEKSKDYQDWADQNGADEVIVLESSFLVGPSGPKELSPNETHSNWNWILVRKKGDEWKHVDHGY